MLQSTGWASYWQSHETERSGALDLQGYGVEEAIDAQELNFNSIIGICYATIRPLNTQIALASSMSRLETQKPTATE